jgi:hypothetical protein
VYWHIVSYYRVQIYDFLVKKVRFALAFYKLLVEKPRFLLSSSLRLDVIDRILGSGAPALGKCSQQIDGEHDDKGEQQGHQFHADGQARDAALACLIQESEHP